MNEQATDQAVTEEVPQKASDMSAEQLDQAIDEVLAQSEDEAEVEDVAIPSEHLPEQTEETSTETETTSQEAAQETQVETETEEQDAPEYLKETPFKSPEKLAEGYSNLSSLLKRQAQELGELRKRANEPVRQEQQYAPNPQQTEGEFDPYDKQQIDRLIAQRLQAAVKPLEEKASHYEGMLANQTREAENVKWEMQANKLAERFPEMKVNGKIAEIVDIIQTSRTQGVDPSTVHPEAAKVEKLAELVKQVKASNGLFNEISDAYTWERVRNDGLDKLLLEQKQRAVVETVKKVSKKDASAQTLAKVGGDSPKKTLKNLSREELDHLVDVVAEQEQDEWESRNL